MKDLMKLFPHLKFEFFFTDEAFDYASGWTITPDYDDSLSALVFLPSGADSDYSIVTINNEGRGTIDEANDYLHASSLGEAFDKGARLLGHCRV